MIETICGSEDLLNLSSFRLTRVTTYPTEVRMSADAERNPFGIDMSRVWLFDIDGTLVSFGGAGSLAMGRALEETFQVNACLDAVSFAGRTDFAITRDIFAAHSIEFESETITAFYDCYLQHSPVAMTSCNGTVLPGVRSLLDVLQNTTDQLGILTGNMQLAAEIKLRHFGIDGYFSFGGFGGEHENRNDVAAEAVTQLQRITAADVEPASVWVIGDTPNDIACARSQKLNAVAVATGSYSVDTLAEYEPDVLLESLERLEIEEFRV